MAVVVPILRLYLLFLNVFETFKTLKPPRRSPRTGEPTPRAVSQRKRDMKGCMAIWLLWCSCAVVEGMADNTVGLVMPFYNEIKAIIYIFQIITRARGAEPIYLHVMRPLVKPYVTTLDYALELVQIIGDFVFLVISLPFGFLIGWWRPTAAVSSAPSTASEDEASESGAQTPEVQFNHEKKPVRQLSNGGAVGTRVRGVRQSSDSAVAFSRIARSNGIPQSRSDVTVNKQKIWRPPANSRDEDEYGEPPRNRRVVSDSATSVTGVSSESSTPPVQTPSEFGEMTVAVEEVEEWRQYPPFPSAYPTTPQIRPKPINAAPSTQRQTNLDPVSEIPRPQSYASSTLPSSREPRFKPKTVAAGSTSQTLPSRTGRRKLHSEDEAVKVQDFGLSLERLRVSPTNVKTSSGDEQTVDLDEEKEDDKEFSEDDDEDEDDTLNITLRTPPRSTFKNTLPRVRMPSHDVSPPPELRGFDQTSGRADNESEGDTAAQLAEPSYLAAPPNNRRANSNYTLSSTRTGRTDSQASLTTVSRASSERAFSRAPSLASKQSGDSASDIASDASSGTGVKRPQPLQDKPVQGKATIKPLVKRTITRPTVAPAKKENAPAGTIRARPSNSRPNVSMRPVKPSRAATLKPIPKVTTDATTAEKDEKDAGHSIVSEFGIIGEGDGTVRKRKVKSDGTTGRIERAPSSLEQIPEERVATRNRS